MIVKRQTKNWLKKAIFGCLFAVMGMFGLAVASPVEQAHAYQLEDSVAEVAVDNDVEVEVTEEVVEETAEDAENSAVEIKSEVSCNDSLGSLGWLICPTTGKISEAVDWLYRKIEDILIVDPVEMKDGSPIYEIWKYARGVTNVVFIILFLVVIYSQITGVGISNYGIKKVLPKMIVVAILMNLSFIICSLAVDASNIIGNSLRGLFTSIEASTLTTMNLATTSNISLSGMYSALAGGTSLAVGAGIIAFENGSIWMLIPVALGAIVAVATGLITIALRQAVVALLIMISPLAIVAYMLPNTEGLFKKWKKLLTQMLVFYPMFSLLFGASSLAGWAIIASAKDGFGLILGVAVQIFPLFFSWNLMKMSGTFLSTINGKLQGMAARPLATNRAWADSHRQQTRAMNMQYGQSPYMRLQRFLDNRKALRDYTAKTAQSLRNNEKEIYVQKKIAAGYDGTKSTSTSGQFKPNKYTRLTKDLSNSSLAVETTKMDTKHAINNYENYYVDKNVRAKVKAAKVARDERTLADIAARDEDHRRAAIAANNYLEYSRAKMTAENDSEADFNFMVNEYIDATLNHDPSRNDGRFSKYRHYILSSAGGLGESGQTRVLGKIIAQAAAVESNQRRDINIVAAKFPPDKTKFRNMLVGYLVDDDGYAVDKSGKRLEKIRGSLLKENPDKLVLWDKVDENGPYYDWYDTNGNYVTRIYKKDKSAIKELLSNFDAPINDPINNLYGILAGIKEGAVQGESENLKYIGLDSFRTTVGRAVLNAPFKEKNAAFSPMVAEMINKGYIKNYAVEYLAYLDSLNKATKPGAFNVQDSDAIEMFATIMDPDNWDSIFAKELVKDFRNVNGKMLTGIRYVDGVKTEVPIEEATQEEVMAKIKEKFIFPAAHKIMVMMSRQTQNTSDNQKAGTIEKWKKLKDIFDTKWSGNSALEDPYEQAGDMRSMAWEIQDQLYTINENGERVGVREQRRRRGMNNNGNSNVNYRYVSASAHHEAIEGFYITSNNDPDEFAYKFAEYCDGYPELDRASKDFRNYINDQEARRVVLTVDDLREFADSLIDSYITD